MEPAIAAALIPGILSLVGVVILVIFNMRQSHQTIQSAEGIALRELSRAQGSELRVEITAMKVLLQRCEEDRAADAIQRAADADRHAADEEQRRIDAERHRADEARHAIDQGEIDRTRQDLSSVQHDLSEIRRKLRSMADAAKIFGEETTAAQEGLESKEPS